MHRTVAHSVDRAVVWMVAGLSISKTFIRRLVLIQPIKTRPDMTEKLLNGSLGRKESNRTKMMYISILRIEYITCI